MSSDKKLSNVSIDLQQNIQKLIWGYESETGVKVSKVHVNRINVNTAFVTIDLSIGKI